MLVNAASFQVNGAFDAFHMFGTVELTLGRETRRVRAILSFSGDLTAYGITGRYRTGMKAWPGSVSLRKGWQNEHVSFGFDSRSGKHRKATISFA